MRPHRRCRVQTKKPRGKARERKGYVALPVKGDDDVVCCLADPPSWAAVVRDPWFAGPCKKQRKLCCCGRELCRGGGEFQPVLLFQNLPVMAIKRRYGGV